MSPCINTTNALTLARLFCVRVSTHEHYYRHDDGQHDHEHVGIDFFVRHTHRHSHKRIVHFHAHWPDIHHQHAHGADDE